MSSTRRQFIQNLAVGTTALGIGLPFLPKTKDRLGVALVGLGYYSRDLLAPALQLTKSCYLAGIVTGSSQKAEEWMKKFKIPAKNVYNYQNFDELAKNPDIDVVYVVLPNHLHREYTERAARAGKHVWCEKPMAPTAADCEAMIKACKDNQVSLSIGYRMQHEPNTQELIRFGRQKTYGKVKMLTATAGFVAGDNISKAWRSKKAMGGGALFDMGVYSLNAARYAIGEEPVAVSAQQFTTRPEIFKEVDETTLFTLEFPGGAVAQCSTSLGISMNTLHVTAEKGWYRLEPFQSYNGIMGNTSDGKALNLKTENQQALQMDNDAKAIMAGKAPLVPGEEGWKDIRVVEAIFKSMEQAGKRVLI
jgi:glucose-fructose oxidoreductase